MQTFKDEQHYTQSVEAVLSSYIDPVFLQHKHETLGRQDIRLLENTRDAQRVRLCFAYTEELDTKLPDFARKFLPERQQVKQTSEWDLGTNTARLRVEVKGAPASLEAALQLAAAGEGCVVRMTWKVSVSVPLLGGKLEQLLGEGIRDKAARDAEVTRQLLSA